MRAKLYTILAVAGLSMAGMLQSDAAVTLSFATQTGTSNGPNGLPFVDVNGAALLNSATPATYATNSLFAAIGYETAGSDGSAAGVLSHFVSISTSPYMVPNLLSGSTPRNGLFSGQIYFNAANALPAGAVGQNAWVLIGDNGTDISQSTHIAAYTFGLFGTVDAVNGLTQSFPLTSASVPIIGLERTVTTQPIAGNTYANGVELVSVVPEPSTALLGALGVLGLLRRRRI